MRWPYEQIGVTTARAFRNLLNKIIGDIGADMQEHKDRADNIQAQVDNLVADGDSSPEAAQARVGADGTNYTTLKQRLDAENQSVTAQLAETDSKLEYRPNAIKPLGIITPYGDNQLTHPKVLYFPNGWNGFKYWMAYTPLPYYDESKENPCLAVSNDMVNWGLVNSSLHNGIVDIPGANDYNSDTHLVYRPDTNTLEVWYRGVNERNKTETIYRRTTTDGVTFTPREAMAGANNGKILNFLSPAIIWDNERKVYQIWVVDHYAIRYFETPDGKNWQYIKTLTVYYGEATAAWHIDVEKTDLGYEMLICTKGQATGVRDSLFYALFPSMTGQDWADAIKIIQPNTLGNWDDTAIYRSCLLKIDGTYYVFYAGQNSHKNYGISLSVSTKKNDITTLQGAEVGYSPVRLKEIILSNDDDKTISRIRVNNGITEVWSNGKWHPLAIRKIVDFPLDSELSKDLNSDMAPFFKYTVDGNTVHINLSLPFNTVRTGNVVIGTLPQDARPINTQYITCNLIGATGKIFVNGILRISWDGTVTIATYDNSTQWTRALANGAYFLI